MTKIKNGAQRFQEGGILDEDDLFDDTIELGEMPAGASGSSKLAGELVETGAPAADLGKIGPDGGGMKPIDDNDEVAAAAEAEAAATAAAALAAGEGEGEGAGDDAIPGDEVELTGVEQFLTNYGVQGGIIQYEDGSTARYAELSGPEQAEILSSLTQEAIPSIEEKYNLEDTEVNLLNTIRESGQTPEEFINNMIDFRTQTLLAQQELASVDYEAISDDAIYVKSLRDANPDITTDEVGEELAKAKELKSYTTSVTALRKGYISEQTTANDQVSSEQRQAFEAEVEEQRFAVVQAVENMTDIAGAPVTDQMKEFLLQDLMELNENNDPILMEKVFSDPETMFEVNWYLNYGKDYIKANDTYWKKEVSKAHKAGYQQATGGMPHNPTVISPTGRVHQKVAAANNNNGPADRFGRVLTEEELFDEENNK